jgi:hypothetical protein
MSENPKTSKNRNSVIYRPIRVGFDVFEAGRPHATSRDERTEVRHVRLQIFKGRNFEKISTLLRVRTSAVAKVSQRRSISRRIHQARATYFCSCEFDRHDA